MTELKSPYTGPSLYTTKGVSKEKEIHRWTVNVKVEKLSAQRNNIFWMVAFVAVPLVLFILFDDFQYRFVSGVFLLVGIERAIVALVEYAGKERAFDYIITETSIGIIPSRIKTMGKTQLFFEVSRFKQRFTSRWLYSDLHFTPYKQLKSVEHRDGRLVLNSNFPLWAKVYVVLPEDLKEAQAIESTIQERIYAYNAAKKNK